MRGVQIDLNSEMIALRFPVEVGLVGDTRDTLRMLIPMHEQHGNRRLLELAQNNGTSRDLPMRPQTVAWELGKQLNDDAVICGDSGQNTLYAARQCQMQIRNRHRGLVSWPQLD